MPSAVINTSGTRVKRDVKSDKFSLKIRLDIIPSPGELAYEVHHVNVPVIPPNATNEQKDDPVYLASLPRTWVTNPELSIFVVVPELVVASDVSRWAELYLDPGVIHTLDALWGMDRLGGLSKPLAHYISPLFRGRTKYTTSKVLTKDFEDLIGSVNSKLKGVAISLRRGGGPVNIPESIDVGPAAIDRTDQTYNYTRFSLENPSNGIGTVDTAETWFAQPTTTLVIGTLWYTGSGWSHTCRDREEIGAVASGSKQELSGLDMDIETGDYLGRHHSDGRIELDTAGSSGDSYSSIDQDELTPLNTFSAYPIADRAASLCGTGPEIVTLNPKSNVSLESGNAVGGTFSINPFSKLSPSSGLNLTRIRVLRRTAEVGLSSKMSPVMTTSIRASADIVASSSPSVPTIYVLKPSATVRTFAVPRFAWEVTLRPKANVSVQAYMVHFAVFTITPSGIVSASVRVLFSPSDYYFLQKKVTFMQGEIADLQDQVDGMGGAEFRI